MKKRNLIFIMSIYFGCCNVVATAQKFQWVHPYYGPNSSVRDLIYDNAGGMYLCGQVRPSNLLFDSVPVYWFGYEDGFVMKADTTSGNINWIHNIGYAGSQESCTKLAKLNNSLFVTGYSQYGLILDTLTISNSGGTDYIASFDTSGPFNWLTTKGAIDIDVDNSGTIYFSGAWLPFPGAGYQYHLYRMSPAGVVTDSLFLFSSHNGYGNRLLYDHKGNLIFTQYFPDSITFLGTTYYGYPNQPSYSYDYLMLECDTLFNVKSVKHLSSAGYNYVNDMILDNQGMIKTIAEWDDTVSFGGTVIPGSGNRIVIATFDTNLTLINHTDLNLSCLGCGVQIVENDLNEFFLGISFTNKVIIDVDTILSGYPTYPGDGLIAKLNGNQVGWYRTIANDSLSSGAASIFLSKPDGNKMYVAGTMSPFTVVIDTTTFNITAASFAYSGLLIDTTYGLFTGLPFLTQNSSDFQVFPNPAKNSFVVSVKENILKGKIEILNILGLNVYEMEIFHESKKEINVANISDGIYFVKMFTGEKSYCKKLVVAHD